MLDTRHEVSISYAWQTDSPDDTNRNAIRNALVSAATEIESKKPEFILRIDEATRDMLGADNVPDSIRAKIEAAAIFVGDVTTVTPPPTTPGDKARPCPNPNVTFEVGYAAAHLGWRRMIVLINTHIADFKDLPFDFDRQRVSQFRFKTASDKSGTNQLKKLLVTAITAILDSNPPRPADLKNANPVEIRRRRDIENAEWALRQINIPVLQQHMDDLPGKIDTDILDFYYDYCGVIGSDLFHINDPDLDAGFRGLCTAWRRALAPSYNYHAREQHAFFSNPGDMPLSPEREADWNEIAAARAEMRAQLTTLLDVIRKNYVDIDVKETSRIALENWRKEQDERRNRFSGAT